MVLGVNIMLPSWAGTCSWWELKDRGMCSCECQPLEPHSTLALVIGYSHTQPPSPSGIKIVWCASPSTHRRRIWFHSYSVFLYESDFQDSLVAPIKWQNIFKPCTWRKWINAFLQLCSIVVYRWPRWSQVAWILPRLLQTSCSNSLPSLSVRFCVIHFLTL